MLVDMRINIRGQCVANAKKLILDSLNSGPTPSAELEALVKDAGLSRSTYNKARKALGVVSFVERGTWYSAIISDAGEAA